MFQLIEMQTVSCLFVFKIIILLNALALCCTACQCCRRAASQRRDVTAGAAGLPTPFSPSAADYDTKASLLQDSPLPHLKLIQSPPSSSDCYPIPKVCRVFHPDEMQHFLCAARLQKNLSIDVRMGVNAGEGDAV